MHIIGAAFYLAAFGIGWMVMMLGWGIQPVSWPWIIGGTFAGMIAMGVGQYIISENKE